MNKKGRSNKKVPEDSGKGKKGKSDSSSLSSSSSPPPPGVHQERKQKQQYNRQEVLDYVEQLEADAEAEAIATEIETVVDKEPEMKTETTPKKEKKKKKDDIVKKKSKTKKVSSSSKSSPLASEEDGIKVGSDQPTTKSMTTSKTKKKGKGKAKTNVKNNSSKDGEVQDDCTTTTTDDVEKTRLRRSRHEAANFDTPGAFSVDSGGIVSDDDDVEVDVDVVDCHDDHYGDYDDIINVERDDLANQQSLPVPTSSRPLLTVSTESQDYTLASSEPIVATLVVESDHDDDDDGNGGNGDDDHDDDEETGNSRFVKPPLVTASAEPLQEMTQSTQHSFWKSKTFKVLVLIVVLLVIAIIVVVSLLSNNQQSQTQASTSNAGDGDDDDVDDEGEEGGGDGRRCPWAPSKPGMAVCNSQSNPVQLIPDDDKGYTTSNFNMREWTRMTIIAEFQNDARSDFTVTDIEVWTGGPNGVGGDNYPPISRVEGYPSYYRDNFIVRQDEPFVLAIEVDLSETPCTHDRLFLRGQSAELGRLGQNRMILLESSVGCFDE